MTALLGLWIARITDNGPDSARLTKWHYVESDIAGRQITHCGRQLGDIPGTVLAPLLKPPTTTDTCRRCDPVLQ